MRGGCRSSAGGARPRTTTTSTPAHAGPPAQNATAPARREHAGAALLIRLLGPLEDLDEPPALGRRQRTGLHQRNPVADTGDAVLVVRLHLGGGADDLAVERVLHPVLELDHDGLLHLVRHHVADARLTPAARLLGARGVLGALVFRRGLCFCHYDSSPAGPEARPNSRSRSTVYTRAIS